MPVGIIRDSHHRTLLGPSSLMMPEVVECDRRKLIPVLYEKNNLGTAVRNFDVIKIYPNSSILPKYFYLDTPQNKALSLNQ